MLRAVFRLLLLSLLLPLTACAQSGPPELGVDYEMLDNGQMWQPEKGKIEVVEFFGYYCGHCANFQPLVDKWKQTLPKDVSFRYVPAVFDLDNSYARAYFAAEIAGALPKTHSELFLAIHRDGSVPMHNATIEELGTYFAARGLNSDKMIALMRSKQVDEKMKRAKAFAIANKVQSTPTMIVNGKYSVAGGRTLERRLEITNAVIVEARKAAGMR